MSNPTQTTHMCIELSWPHRYIFIIGIFRNNEVRKINRKETGRAANSIRGVPADPKNTNRRRGLSIAWLHATMKFSSCTPDILPAAALGHQPLFALSFWSGLSTRPPTSFQGPGFLFAWPPQQIVNVDENLFALRR